MKIREIYVKSFGCLSDFKKEFHDGFNAVTENNGFGKTTLATFVKAMFYSLGYSPFKRVGRKRAKTLPSLEQHGKIRRQRDIRA